jgi:hypothetical protein
VKAQSSLFDAPTVDMGRSAFDPKSVTVAPSPHVQARQTSALAGLANLPKRGSQNEMVLGLITAAGDRGLNDRELQQMTGYSRQTLCLRRYDLKALIGPAATRDIDPLTHRQFTRWRRR